MDRFDVAIVGAGPAGSRAAWRLARKGVRVALVDGSHPREKPCGGGVTGRALDLVADALATGAVPSVEVESATFAYGGRTARVGLSSHDRPPLRVVGRRDFDGALFEGAIAAGAVPVRARATSIERDGRAWSIATRDGTIAAAWLLGADGATSLVRRRVLAPFERHDLSIAAGYFVHGLSQADIVIGFEDAPPGYLWSFPRPDHLAIGICAQANESSSAALLRSVGGWIDRNVDAPHSVRERYAWPIPSLSADTLALPMAGTGWMLLGDAAGFVDPITREGIFFALTSADRAADALLDGSGDPGRLYDGRVRAEISSELIRAARLKARFFVPRFMGMLVMALQRSDSIRAIMADLVAGHQTYRGLRRRLIGTLEFRLMAQLFGLQRLD